MCEYCKKQDMKTINIKKFDNVELEFWIQYGELCYNSYNHAYSNITAEIYGEFKINYCPMCGEKLS